MTLQFLKFMESASDFFTPKKFSKELLNFEIC